MHGSTYPDRHKLRDIRITFWDFWSIHETIPSSNVTTCIKHAVDLNPSDITKQIADALGHLPLKNRLLQRRSPSRVVAHQVVAVMRKLCLASFVQSHGACMSLGIFITFPGTSFLRAFGMVCSTNWDRSPLVAWSQKGMTSEPRNFPSFQNIHQNIHLSITALLGHPNNPNPRKTISGCWGGTRELVFHHNWIHQPAQLLVMDPSATRRINSELVFFQSEKWCRIQELGVVQRCLCWVCPQLTWRGV